MYLKYLCLYFVLLLKNYIWVKYMDNSTQILKFTITLVAIILDLFLMPNIKQQLQVTETKKQTNNAIPAIG